MVNMDTYLVSGEDLHQGFVLVSLVERLVLLRVRPKLYQSQESVQNMFLRYSP